MKTTTTWLCAIGIGVAMWGEPRARGDTPGEQTPQGQASMTAKKASASATVVSVDTKKRHLVLRGEDGKQFTLEVPDTVKRLDEIKKGDKIKVDYFEAVAVTLKKSDKATPSAGETTVVDREKGKLPSGSIAHQITVTAQIVDIDKSKNQVTIKRPNGDLDKIDVTDPQMQQDLSKLSVGDRIEATYTEGAAINVTREGATETKPEMKPEDKSMNKDMNKGGMKGEGGSDMPEDKSKTP